MLARTRVLVIDDSALMRQLLPEILKQDPALEVVGTAGDAYAGWDKITALQPDVITLDVEMPRMDGLTFLDKLMRMRPMPVVMVSSLTERGCETTLRALQLGAIDFVTKPKIDVASGTVILGEELIEKVKTAATARIRSVGTRPSVDRPRVAAAPPESLMRSTNLIVAIGTSTGGTEALHEVLTQLPGDAPGIVAVIHMPENFTRSFAERLNRECQIRVREARDGERILPGQALIAPGNYHMSVVRHAGVCAVAVEQSDPVNRHRPSVDVFVPFLRANQGSNAVGIILTGMGADGAAGLLAMRRAGARTVAQDEASCVVFGMPGQAIALDAVDEVLPLDRIASRIVALARQRAGKGTMHGAVQP